MAFLANAGKAVESWFKGPAVLTDEEREGKKNEFIKVLASYGIQAKFVIDLRRENEEAKHIARGFYRLDLDWDWAEKIYKKIGDSDWSSWLFDFRTEPGQVVKTNVPKPSSFPASGLVREPFAWYDQGRTPNDIVTGKTATSMREEVTWRDAGVDADDDFWKLDSTVELQYMSNPANLGRTNRQAVIQFTQNYMSSTFENDVEPFLKRILKQIKMPNITEAKADAAIAGAASDATVASALSGKSPDVQQKVQAARDDPQTAVDLNASSNPKDEEAAEALTKIANKTTADAAPALTNGQIQAASEDVPGVTPEAVKVAEAAKDNPEDVGRLLNNPQNETEKKAGDVVKAATAKEAGFDYKSNAPAQPKEGWNAWYNNWEKKKGSVYDNWWSQHNFVSGLNDSPTAGPLSTFSGPVSSKKRRTRSPRRRQVSRRRSRSLSRSKPRPKAKSRSRSKPRSRSRSRSRAARPKRRNSRRAL